MRRGRAAGIAAALATVLATVLVVTGCAPAVDEAWQPPTWPAPDVNVVSAPAPLDADAVENLRAQRIRNDDVGIQARFVLVPGDAPLNAAVRDTVRAAVSGAEENTGVPYEPQVFPATTGMGDRSCIEGSTLRDAAEVLADPVLGPVDATGTALVCDVVAASGSFLGLRLRTVTGAGGVVASDTSVLLYTDVETGEVTDAAGLWADGAADVLWEDVVDAIRRDNGALSLAPVAPPDEAGLALLDAAFAGTLVAADGTLVVTIPAGFTAPELDALGVAATTEPSTVGIAPELSTAVTSGFGTRLVAAAGTPVIPFAAVPAGFETVDCSLVPCVAMTYDDGPAGWTAEILDAAAAHNGAVTFFALGSRADAWSETIQRAVREGHLVENHSWNHPDLTTLDPEQIEAQLVDTTRAIEAASGVPVRMFRPPYGEYDDEVLEIAGMPAILWDVDTRDWAGVSEAALVREAVDTPRPGSIVLQHDIQTNTGQTVAEVYAGLADRGFSLVTVTQLFGGALPASGAVRSAR